MDAIITRYLGPTNTLGGRIKATCEGVSVTLPYRHELDSENNHREAAWAIIAKAGRERSNFVLISAQTDNGYCHIYRIEQ